MAGGITLNQVEKFDEATDVEVDTDHVEAIHDDPTVGVAKASTLKSLTQPSTGGPNSRNPGGSDRGAKINLQC